VANDHDDLDLEGAYGILDGGSSAGELGLQLTADMSERAFVKFHGGKAGIRRFLRVITLS
jgi:hypothetical protein